MTKLISSLAALLALSTFSTTASALDPETAGLVTDVTLEVASTFRVDEDEVALVGIEECQEMVSNESTVKVIFATAFDPTTVDGATLYEESDHFRVPRDSTARIDCATGDLCVVADEEDEVSLGTDNITVELDFEVLTGITTGEDCAGFDEEFFIRTVVNESATSSTLENADAKIIIDTIRPTAPTAVVATATENTITVEFDGVEDADVDSYHVFWSKTGFEGGAFPGDLELTRSPLGDDTSGTVNADLDPTGTIFVAVAARDETGNFSALSAPTEISVVETDDFWEAYRAAGGNETGGCATGSGPLGLLPLLLAFGAILLGRRRRSRNLLVASTAALVLLAPLSATAETPTSGAFALKLGGYYPAIDDEFGGSGPFTEVFGEENLVMGEIEVNGWLYQGFGKVGLGGSWGFSRVKGTALATDATESDAVADTTTFGVMPFRAFALYRFDWLALHTRIPLSVSVEGGFDFYRWRIADGAGDTASFDGDAASGWKPGYHIGGELQFLLDFLDPATAAAFDLNWGVNNSYFFVEYLMTKVDDFGGDGFDLSDNIVMLGLNFEF